MSHVARRRVRRARRGREAPPASGQTSSIPTCRAIVSRTSLESASTATLERTHVPRQWISLIQVARGVRLLGTDAVAKHPRGERSIPTTSIPPAVSASVPLAPSLGQVPRWDRYLAHVHSPTRVSRNPTALTLPAWQRHESREPSFPPAAVCIWHTGHVQQWVLPHMIW